MTFQQKEKRVKPRDFKFTKLLFFWATVYIQFWSQSWKHLWLHCLAESKGCSLYIIIFPPKVATSPTTTSRLLLQPPGHVAAGLEGRGLGPVARHEHGVRNETQFWTVGVWTCCCCTPDSSAGDPMLSDWPILPQNSLQRADGDEKTQINSSDFFLGRMVPFPCSIPGVRKGSQHFSQRSPLDTLEGGTSTTSPEHRHTKEPFRHISEVSSADQNLSSSYTGRVPLGAPVVCASWCRQRGLLPTTTETIGISSSSSYCQEQGFYFPQALMTLSTCRNTQLCLCLQQLLHNVHLDFFPWKNEKPKSTCSRGWLQCAGCKAPQGLPTWWPCKPAWQKGTSNYLLDVPLRNLHSWTAQAWGISPKKASP